MAKQRVHPGGELDIPTPEELAEVFRTPYERVIISLGAANAVEEIHDDIPAKGIRSIATAFQRGAGSDNFVVAANVFTELCPRRAGRLAGTIQNIGANPCLAYLAPLNEVKRQGPQGTINGFIVGYIAPGGGSFDFKLTNDCWGGPVTVWSLLGTTLVWGEH